MKRLTCRLPLRTAGEGQPARIGHDHGELDPTDHDPHTKQVAHPPGTHVQLAVAEQPAFRLTADAVAAERHEVETRGDDHLAIAGVDRGTETASASHAVA